MSKGHIFVDLDGTLAEYDGWKGARHIGPPVPGMVQMVKTALARDYRVSIFTARVSTEDLDPVEIAKARVYIEAWCLLHLGRSLPITANKAHSMTELWDDRALGIAKNQALPRDPNKSVFAELYPLTLGRQYHSPLPPPCGKEGCTIQPPHQHTAEN